MATVSALVARLGRPRPRFPRISRFLCRGPAPASALARGEAAASWVPAMSKFDVQAPSSNFGVRGREALGGGLTAWFQIEQNTPLEREATQAVTVASRNSAAGIQGGFGNVFVGQWTTPWADMDSLWAVGQASRLGPRPLILGR